MISSELQVDLDPPVVNWTSDSTEFTVQKDFVFGVDLTCCIEVINCSFSLENYSEIVEAIAREVFELDGEVNISESGDEVLTSFEFEGAMKTQTHLFLELSPNSVAHLTVFSKVLESQGESLKRYLKSLEIQTKVLDESQNLDLLSFSLV